MTTIDNLFVTSRVRYSIEYTTFSYLFFLLSFSHLWHSYFAFRVYNNYNYINKQAHNLIDSADHKFEHLAGGASTFHKQREFQLPRSHDGMSDDRAPKRSQKENRPRVRASFRRPINRSAAFRPRTNRDVHKEIHGRLPKRKVVPTLTRTNAPMNNRVILFREPIRLSVVQKYG